MSRHIGRLFTRPVVLTATALVLHVGAATAADSKGGIQQQMRELLTGNPVTHFVPQSGPRDAKATTPAVDSQEFVKQLLLGTAAYRVGGPETEAQKRPVASVDMQAQVRQLLLGPSHASDSSQLAARSTH